MAPPSVSRTSRDRLGWRHFRGSVGSADDAAIATAIVSLAKSLNLKVIAEGVETEAQLAFLRDHDRDEVQGYYLSKPLRAEQVSEILPFLVARTMSAANAS